MMDIPISKAVQFIKRKIQIHDQTIYVTDEVTANDILEKINIFFHLMPNFNVSILDKKSCLIESEMTKIIFKSLSSNIQLIENEYCTSFGRVEKTRSILIQNFNTKSFSNNVTIIFQE